MSKDQRKVNVYDIVLSALGKYKVNDKNETVLLDPLPLSLIIKKFKSLQNTLIIIGEKDVFYLQQILYTKDIQSNTEKVTLLINKSDPSAPNPTFVAVKTKRRRTVSKEQGEGIEYSCHVVINLQSTTNRYKTIIEITQPGVPISSIRRIIEKLIQECTKNFKKDFLTAHPSGEKDATGKSIKLLRKHEVAIQGHLSDDFVKDIKDAEILDVELIDTEPNIALDNAQVIEKAEIIKLEVIGKRISSNSTTKGFFTKIFKDYGPKYDLAKIEFKTQENAKKTVRLNTSSFTINGRDYIKSYFVTAPINNNTSYATIQTKLTDEMFNFIK